MAASISQISFLSSREIPNIKIFLFSPPNLKYLYVSKTFWITFPERIWKFGPLKSLSTKMSFQFLSTSIAKPSFTITANASSCCVKQPELLSLRKTAQSSLCFFFLVSSSDPEQWLWTGAKASAGIWVSLWRKGPLGRISVVQEMGSSVKLSWKIRSRGEKNPYKKRKHWVLSWSCWAPCRVSPYVCCVSATEPGWGQQFFWVLLHGQGPHGLPQTSTLPALQPNHRFEPTGLSPHAVSSHLSRTVCPVQAELGHP